MPQSGARSFGRSADVLPPTQLKQLEIGQLRSFLLVCDLGSITAAAERQGLTQSAVSMQMRRLESQVGRQVLLLEARRMVPTEEGTVLLDYARQILDLNDQAITRLTGAGITGEVRFGFVEDAAAYGLAEILRSFHQEYPHVRLQLRVSQSHLLIGQLDCGKLDVVLAKAAPDGRIGETLVSEPLVWVAASGYALPEHSRVSLVCSPQPCVNRHAMTTTLARARVPFQIVCSSATQSGIHLAVWAGLGVTAMPERTIVSGMDRLPSDLLPALPRRSIYLFKADRRLSPAHLHLIEHVTKCFGATDPAAASGPGTGPKARRERSCI